MFEVASVIIPIFIFFIAVFFVARRFRDATLDKLQLLPRERILLEDACERVEAKTGTKPAIFPKTLVRITNMRIIVAQRALFSKEKYVLRYVIAYKDSATIPSGYGGGALKLGYISFSADLNNMKVRKEKNKKYFEILPARNGGLSAIPLYLRVYTNRLEEYQRIVKMRAGK